jgi:hypothetical protein
MAPLPGEAVKGTGRAAPRPRPPIGRTCDRKLISSSGRPVAACPRRALVHVSYAASMPDSVGKRQRRDVKAKKAVAREKRRVARNKRREDRATGLPPLTPGPNEADDGAE